MISIICYFSLCSVVLAFDMSIYNGSVYYSNSISSEDKKPVKTLKNKYEFSYNLNEVLNLDVRLKNKAPSVIAEAYITQQPVTNITTGDTSRKNTMICNDGDPCFYFNGIQLNTPAIFIGLQLSYTENVSCHTNIVIQGNASITRKRDICVSPNHCIISIDLQNVCNASVTEQPPTTQPTAESPLTLSESHTLPYVISSVIAITCVLTVAICLCVKKFCHRNSSLVETTDMNSYDLSKEVIYAELGFQQDRLRPNEVHPPILSHPPPPSYQEEECPYAQIIGVLKPKT